MDVLAKEGCLYLQGVKFGKRIWRRSWVLLFQPSLAGVGRMEMYDVRDGGSVTPSRPPGLKKADKKVIRLSDCLSITPAPGESCPPDCITFYLNTTQRTYTLAGLTHDKWVPTLCQLAFQRSEGGSETRRAQTDVSMYENDLYSTWSPGQYQVSVQKSEASVRCRMSGSYLLSPGKEELCLLDLKTGQTVYSWPYRLLRRFGQIKEGITIEAGRRCHTGEGHFIFLSKQGPQIYRAIEEAVMHQSVQDLLSKAMCQTQEPVSAQQPPSRPLVEDKVRGGQDSNKPCPALSRRLLALPAPPATVVPPGINTKPQTGPPNPPAINTKPQTGPPNPPAINTKPQTGPPNPPAINTKPQTGPPNPPAINTKPQTGPAKPQTGPPNPPAINTKPQTGPSNLPANITKPPVSATNPPGVNTKPQTGPPNPPANNTKPQKSTAKPPTISTKPPTSTTKSQTGTAKPPEFITNPQTSPAKPPAIIANPPMFTTTPQVSTTNPPMSTTKPPVPTTNRPVLTTNPLAIITYPPAISIKPPAINTKQPNFTTNPPVFITNRPVLTTNPLMSTTNPPMSTTNPPMSTTNPQMFTTNPSMSTTNPPMSTTKPPVFTTKPPVSTTNPPPCIPEEILYATIKPQARPRVIPAPPPVPKNSPITPRQRLEQDIQESHTSSDEDPDSDYCNWSKETGVRQDSPDVEETYSTVIHPSTHSMEDHTTPCPTSTIISSSNIPLNFKQTLSNVLFRDPGRVAPAFLPKSSRGSSDQLAELDVEMDDTDYWEIQK